MTADRGVLRPERNQAPLQRAEAALALVLANDGDGPSRRQVVARLHGSDEIIKAEVLLENLGRNEQAEPAAHVTP